MGLEELAEVAAGAEFLLNPVVTGDGAVEQGERRGGLEGADVGAEEAGEVPQRLLVKLRGAKVVRGAGLKGEDQDVPPRLVKGRLNRWPVEVSGAALD